MGIRWTHIEVLVGRRGLWVPTQRKPDRNPSVSGWDTASKKFLGKFTFSCVPFQRERDDFRLQIKYRKFARQRDHCTYIYGVDIYDEN